MSALDPRHAQLAELFGRYVRSTGVERNRLGAQLDELAPQVLTRKETTDATRQTPCAADSAA